MPGPTSTTPVMRSIVRRTGGRRKISPALAKNEIARPIFHLLNLFFIFLTRMQRPSHHFFIYAVL